MKANAVGSFFKKYTMILALVAVAIFFTITTQGKILFSQNINNLISQNGYVFVLAAGMLCCILTGGNIDLSVGSVVCFTGAIGAVLMQGGANMWVAVVAMFIVGLLSARSRASGSPGSTCPPSSPRWPACTPSAACPT